MAPLFGESNVEHNPIYDKFYAQLVIEHNGYRVVDALNARLITFDARENQTNGLGVSHNFLPLYYVEKIDLTIAEMHSFVLENNLINVKLTLKEDKV